MGASPVKLTWEMPLPARKLQAIQAQLTKDAKIGWGRLCHRYTGHEAGLGEQLTHSPRDDPFPTQMTTSLTDLLMSSFRLHKQTGDFANNPCINRAVRLKRCFPVITRSWYSWSFISFHCLWTSCVPGNRPDVTIWDFWAPPWKAVITGITLHRGRDGGLMGFTHWFQRESWWLPGQLPYCSLVSFFKSVDCLDPALSNMAHHFGWLLLDQHRRQTLRKERLPDDENSFIIAITVATIAGSMGFEEGAV